MKSLHDFLQEKYQEIREKDVIANCVVDWPTFLAKVAKSRGRYVEYPMVVEKDNVKFMPKGDGSKLRIMLSSETAYKEDQRVIAREAEAYLRTKGLESTSIPRGTICKVSDSKIFP